MLSKDLYNKYLIAQGERLELEHKIDDFINRWETGELVNISSKVAQETIDKGYQRLAGLKKKEESLHKAYKEQEVFEKKRNSAEMRIDHYLGERPQAFKFIGESAKGVNNTMLPVMAAKTPEELEKDRNRLLADLKGKVLKGEIEKSVASSLFEDIKFLYTSAYINEPDQEEKESTQEKKNTTHR